jgi:mRNA interferase RelE/StbE
VKEIAYSNGTLKSLRRFPSNEAERIREKIEQYAGDPASLANNVKKLRGRDGFRLRIGDWRVTFDEDKDKISVLVIAPRSSAYG